MSNTTTIIISMTTRTMYMQRLQADPMTLTLLQNPFWDRIQHVRNTELATLWKSFRVQTFNSFLLNAIPTIVSVVTFTVYVLLGNQLTAAKAFTSLSLFSVSYLAYPY